MTVINRISKHSDGSQIDPLNLKGLSDLWGLTLGSPEITIAILDGPCDTTHHSLTQANITKIDLIDSGTIDSPAGEHGTHTASIILGQHNNQVKGIAPNSHGLIIPIFSSTPQGGILACSQPDLARAIRVAADEGANIINISAGQFSFTGTAHPMLADVIEACHSEGRLIVSAVGNDGCSCLHIPGAIPSVLAVGAMDMNGNPMEFSNWGHQYQTSGILAPGLNILGALPGQKFGVRTGTSFATPFISGIAALLLSLQKAQGQNLSVQEVRRAILESAQGCEYDEVADCRRLLVGRVNVNGAVSKIMSLYNNNPGEKIMSNSSDESNTNNVDALSSLETSPQSIQKSKVGMLDISVENIKSEEKVMAAQYTAQAPTPRSTLNHSAITASSCACQQNGELVYILVG